MVLRLVDTDAVNKLMSGIWQDWLLDDIRRAYITHSSSEGQQGGRGGHSDSRPQKSALNASYEQ